jgi:hypothetical protein
LAFRGKWHSLEGPVAAAAGHEVEAYIGSVLVEVVPMPCSGIFFNLHNFLSFVFTQFEFLEWLQVLEE